VKSLLLHKPDRTTSFITVERDSDQYWITKIGTFKKSSGRLLSDPRYYVSEPKPPPEQAQA
jgi:hypothetical protein